jgi:hypothetical protein
MMPAIHGKHHAGEIGLQNALPIRILGERQRRQTANTLAQARPMPLPPPVTNACWPSSFPAIQAASVAIRKR